MMPRKARVGMSGSTPGPTTSRKEGCKVVMMMTPDMFANTDLTPFYVILTLVCVVAFIFAAMNSR